MYINTDKGLLRHTYEYLSRIQSLSSLLGHVWLIWMWKMLGSWLDVMNAVRMSPVCRLEWRSCSACVDKGTTLVAAKVTGTIAIVVGCWHFRGDRRKLDSPFHALCRGRTLPSNWPLRDLRPSVFCIIWIYSSGFSVVFSIHEKSIWVWRIPAEIAHLILCAFVSFADSMSAAVYFVHPPRGPG